jgi:hypothetical protein
MEGNESLDEEQQGVLRSLLMEDNENLTYEESAVLRGMLVKRRRVVC